MAGSTIFLSSDKWRKKNILRAAISISLFILFLEISSRSNLLFGFKMPFFGDLPKPSDVVKVFAQVIFDSRYWYSWIASTWRVLGGFLIALLLGVPLALCLALNKTFKGIFFPIFEFIRPIPPLAWVPAAIIFWPTQELAIMFITFLGAFFTIVINTFGGALSIDLRFLQAARSLGASKLDMFRRIVLPACIPSVVVGATIGIGITWEVVVAAEMISGASKVGGKGAGLGHLIWSNYIGGNYEMIVVGMVSIGIAGYICSTVIRYIGGHFTSWEASK
ncbi:ABC transporter permease [Polynucleobacter sp. IMCC 29146]|uniref:ABC transporter permease n=1 Tax=Polynucleobacter sp. IMCC 29146 TaxID=2780953 RepID=UPI001F3E980F|nr:ABC transporter permease [Polynucleobacter sp. IMCC 29146]MCE7530689.1 ABC transporter permease [Polynucleobacter sp. IMCC 29146]